MTETEWLASDDPAPMIRWLRGRVSDRKFRWFAIACCRRIWDRLKDSRSRAAVEFAEHHAEIGVARRKGRPAIEKTARAACQQAEMAEVATRCQDLVENAVCRIDVNASHAAWATVEGCAWLAAEWAAGFSANATGWAWMVASRRDSLPAWDGSAKRPEAAIQIRILRDIFGNPFRPSPSLPAAVRGWNDGTIPKIVQGIYEERAFDRMPILADALLDAGCDDEDILAHCRSAGPHVRGCWVVDLILGKE